MKHVLFRITVFLLVIGAGTATGGYIALVQGVPQVDEIKAYQPSKSTEVYADDDTLIGEFRVEKGDFVKISDIPEHLIKAVVAVEDSRFWYHRGVDTLGILRALLKDIRAGRFKEGASTITQQLTKVVFLSPERTIVRKLKEIVLAMRIEKNLSKEEILELYLNKIYFGHGAYGIEMAARAYFGKTVSEINLSEAALLCGLIKAPSRYSPYSNLDKAKERQQIVLKRMTIEGYITEEQATEAFELPLYLSSVRYKRYTPNYFLEYVRKYLEDEYGVEMTYKGGLKVYTTLNRDVQIAAVESLKQGLRQLDKRQGYRGPLGYKEINPDGDAQKTGSAKKVVLKRGDRVTATVTEVSASKAGAVARGTTGTLHLEDALWAKKIIDEKGEVVNEFKDLKLTDILRPGDMITVSVKDAAGGEPVFALEQEPLVQGAVVSIEPSTGYIRAIVGGYDFNRSEFNRAVFARRQAGSAFKPIIFAASMDHGYTPSSIIMDEPLLYESEEYGDWEPENYDEMYHGATRLRDALIHSRNIVTVKLLEAIGVDTAIQFARELGLNGPFPHNLTLALGSLSISPLEITSIFSIFANQGVKMEPIAIKYVIDASGDILENNQPKGESVISPQTAFLATSMLEDVVKSGTGWRAKALKRSVAGKTGTTNEYNDAWFIGYTPELATSVWVGFDNMRSLGKNETGSKAAAPVWVSFMKRALTELSVFNRGPRREKGGNFPIPDGIVTAVIDPLTGLLATNETKKMVEFFKEGTVPTVYTTEFFRDLILKHKEELKKIAAIKKLAKKKAEERERSLIN